MTAKQGVAHHMLFRKRSEWERKFVPNRRQVIPFRMAAAFAVPILRRAKNSVQVLICHDAKRVKHFVFDCLDDSLDVGLQVG